MFKQKYYSFFLPILWLFLSSFQGMAYRHLNTPVPQSIHVLEVDPHVLQIIPAHANDQVLGRESVKTIANHHQAIAGINGGFFMGGKWAGMPSGILKIQNNWFALQSKPRGAIGWSHDGQDVLIDRLLHSSFVFIQNYHFRIEGLNRERKTDETILFTPQFGSSTLPNRNGLEVIIRQNQIVAIIKGGKNEIPADGCVLSLPAKYDENFWLHISPGTPVQVQILLIPQSPFTSPTAWNRCPNIVGGTPVLIQHGELINDFSPEKTLQSFLTKRHARTAIGILPNGHWLFVVVDGNQPKISQGMTMRELASLMAQLGCVQALNLDGGGSSTMVIQGEVVNDPVGDEDEDQGLKRVRHVSDAILIREKP